MHTFTPTQWDTRDSDDGTHILCGGPLAGQRIRFRRKGDDNVIEGIVAIHWHYDGCVLDVEAGDECGTVARFGLHPQFGDEVEVLD